MFIVTEYAALNIRAQLYIGAKRLKFGVGLPILPYYVYKSSDESIEIAHFAVSTEPLLITYGPRREKSCLRRVANNTSADQLVHPRSLTSAFVFRFLESITSKLAISEISTF